MRMVFLVQADLSQLGSENRDNLQRQLDNQFNAVASWRKDRKPEKDMAIPYRVSVRGPDARIAAEWLLEKFLTEWGRIVDIEDIWALPTMDPEEPGGSIEVANSIVL